MASTSNSTSTSAHTLTLGQIFHNARSHNAWLDKPVSDEVLHQIYEAMEYGPTAANSLPGRIKTIQIETRRTYERERCRRPAARAGAQVVRAGDGPEVGEPDGLLGLDPRPRGGERRRQVDARQDRRRPVPARRR
ncbi:MAG: hypothetical protein EOO38_32590 [Cytophagaceae bacterium]|nr:MAG: hypothetical protein EOO38_32590 [Cytophagaceae bacterium]